MGNTGSSCGIHLHFQIYAYGSSAESESALQGLMIDGRPIEDYKVGTLTNPPASEKFYPSTNIER